MRPTQGNLHLIQLKQLCNTKPKLWHIIARVSFEKGFKLRTEICDISERGVDVNADRSTFLVRSRARNVLDSFLGEALVGYLEHGSVVDAPEDCVQDALVDDEARDWWAGGAKVIDLNPVADIERVFEENEDTTAEEFLDRTTCSEGETNGTKAKYLLNFINGGYV